MMNITKKVKSEEDMPLWLIYHILCLSGVKMGFVKIQLRLNFVLGRNIEMATTKLLELSIILGNL